MICVVQRVSSATVEAPESRHMESIGAGLLVLVAIEPDDTKSTVAWMSNKLAHLRVFADDDGKMNRSVLDIGGEIAVVSQFTLVGDCAKGHRPAFTGAASSAQGERLCEMLAQSIQAEHGVSVKTGVFGATMRVCLVNEGPVTVIIERGR